MTEWGYGGEAFGVKHLWEAVNASCPDACPHLFEPQHLTGTSSSACHTQTQHKHCHLCRHKLALLLTPAVLGSCRDWTQK